jgi:hypothetical protein
VALLLAPVAADAVPGGQARHCVALVAPRAADHVPLGQGVHSDVLACAAYVPRGHWLHAKARAREKLPGAQAKQEEELKRAQLELEERRLQEAKMARELEEANVMIEDQYGTMAEEVSAGHCACARTLHALSSHSMPHTSHICARAHTHNGAVLAGG